MSNKVIKEITEVESKQVVKTKDLMIPIKIVVNEWENSTMIERKAEFYLVKSVTPAQQIIVMSGSAKIIVPEKALTINNKWINIPKKGSLNTYIRLPKNTKLIEYLDEGGYEIQILIFEQHGDRFTHVKQNLFDEDTLKNGFNYWFGLRYR